MGPSRSGRFLELLSGTKIVTFRDFPRDSQDRRKTVVFLVMCVPLRRQYQKLNFNVLRYTSHYDGILVDEALQGLYTIAPRIPSELPILPRMKFFVTVKLQESTFVRVRAFVRVLPTDMKLSEPK